ncbi:hypothetical protein BX661DRAFT_99059 [Kickxella alabastrina]|uniref:uncharacterized protein n=1 Tax=Kickxella alabastrina TaxID=61397 RepID=UPI00222023AD|nr:uncharacterized protein BX661DRAFT_99059 [Kickxella alabastrina]KAI7829047.1 hypothetical protein BX661DRAFT_99059 [Kickxella alabastrina]
MATSLALPGSNPFGYHKRPRVNSKAAALGSLFRTRAHTKRNSTSGDSFSPPLAPLDTSDGGWNTGIEYPVVSPLFSEECLQELLGSPPQIVPTSPGMSPMASRRSKLESVLHNSTGPFRRLRSGPAAKTLSFPPAVSEPTVVKPPADEFVVVTTDMCPPAALVSSSVISGVASEAPGAITRRHNPPNSAGRPPTPNGAARARAQTHVSKSSEHLLTMRRGASYTESSESLVRITTPTLSASSSEASLPLALAQAQRQSGLQLPVNSALGPSLKPPAPALATAASGASARKVSECSFSSLEDQRRNSNGMQLAGLSPYIVSSLSKTAAKASERRRRSSVHRPRRGRTNSVTSSGTWGLSAASDATLMAESGQQSGHQRNASNHSQYSGEYDANSASQQSFDFQIRSAESESFWPNDGSPLASDLDDASDDELGALNVASGFPSSCSAHFDFDSKPAAAPSLRQRANTAAPAMITRSADEIRLGSPESSRFAVQEPRGMLSMLDPSSPVHGDGGSALVPLHMLAHSRRQSEAEPMSPYISDQIDFEGSTLTQTQNSDWLLMNPSSSDGEQAMQPHRRRMRKRRVLPRTLFKAASPQQQQQQLGQLDSDAYDRNSKSTETLLLLACDDGCAKAADANAAAAPVLRPAILPLDALRLRDLRIVPRLPASIAQHIHIECVGRLALHCDGRSTVGWASARIPQFTLRFHAALARATGLHTLALVNIGLCAIPTELQRCRGLRRLDMSHNWISAVPGWLARLPQLEHIVVRGNPLRTVAADLVEMRHRLHTLDLGCGQTWAVVHRPMAAVAAMTAAERTDALLARLHATAAKRMAACLAAAQLSLSQRQLDASRDRAMRLIALYSDSIYSSLREPRNLGHSVALPHPPHN